MNTEMVLVGIILFSGMTAGAVKIWLNKRKESKTNEELDNSYKTQVEYFLNNVKNNIKCMNNIDEAIYLIDKINEGIL